MRLVLALSAMALMGSSAAAQSTHAPSTSLPSTNAPAVLANCNRFNQEFKLYFEYESAAITNSAQAVLEQAAENVKGAPPHCAVTEIRVDSYTDSAGSDMRNSHLSIAIALTVEDAINALGFEKTKKTVGAHGEKNPYKATRDGVRSPLNRRTVIKFTMGSK